MLPYFNMINHDSDGTRQRTNQAQAAAIYQAFRRLARAPRLAASGLRGLTRLAARALHHTPQQAARSASDRSSPC